MGIPKRDLITNCFFSKDSNRIREVVKNLEDSGVYQILLSVDAFHQETIPIEPVKVFAECVTKSKIKIKLSPVCRGEYIKHLRKLCSWRNQSYQSKLNTVTALEHIEIRYISLLFVGSKIIELPGRLVLKDLR